MIWDPVPALYFQSGDPACPLRIFFAYLSFHTPSGTYPIDAHLDKLGPKDHVFLFLAWHRLGFYPERLQRYARFPCQVILCANTPEEHAELEAAGVRCIFFNQNAALDERLFDVAAPAEGLHAPRPFRAVLNSTLAPYKRLHLAAKVERLAVVGYLQGSDYHSAAPLPPGSTWMNLHSGALCAGSGSDLSGSAHAAVPGVTSGGPTGSTSAGYRQLGPGSQQGPPQAAGSAHNVGAGTAGQAVYLSAGQVCAALNRCEVGLSLSELEGPCWASSEYLLCGLPVVTTPCSGGREVWYNEGNSIVVQPTQDAVAAGVSQAIQQLRSGAFSRQRIREGALQQARSFRAALNAEVQAIFEEHGVRLSAADWFAEHFCHKMGL
ncbi:hypothetical protein ABPG77_002961 [Micractinium sp. CCAP 211/92]